MRDRLDVRIDYKGLPVYDDFKIAIYNDDDMQNPREVFDELGTLCTFDKHGHWISDKKAKDEFSSPKEVREFIKENNCLALPVYRLSHSGDAVSTNPFSDPWDSGQIGYIFITSEKIAEEYGEDNEDNRERAKTCLKGEIETLNSWLQGEVFGYCIEKDGDEALGVGQSCWGFYSLKDCIDQALDVYADAVALWETPEKAVESITENPNIFEGMPEELKTPAIAEAYLKAGGDLDAVSDDLREKMGLEIRFSDGTTMSM